MNSKGTIEIQKCIYFTISKMFRMVNKIAEESFEELGIYPTHAFLMIILKEERERSGKNSFTKITEEGLKVIPELNKAWKRIGDKIEELVGNDEYLRKTGEDFREFTNLLAKDKTYENMIEEFDFWVI